MKLVVILDKKGGMMFNHRRQSQDAVVKDRILSLADTDGATIFMNAYTGRQFPILPWFVSISETPLEDAGTGDWCFVENLDTSIYAGEIEVLVVYRWDKIYPSDQKFMLNMEDWKLAKAEEFKGKSHEKITEEMYVKKITI